MRLVKLNDTESIMPDQIASLTNDAERNRIIVKLRDGTRTFVPADYGYSCYKKYDELVTAINNAMEN